MLAAEAAFWERFALGRVPEWKRVFVVSPVDGRLGRKNRLRERQTDVLVLYPLEGPLDGGRRTAANQRPLSPVTVN